LGYVEEADDNDEAAAEEVVLFSVDGSRIEELEEVEEAEEEEAEDEALFALINPFWIFRRSPKRLFTPLPSGCLNDYRRVRKGFSPGVVSASDGGIDEKCLKRESILV